MSMSEEEAKIRAELEKEIEKDLEEEMKYNISRLTHKLAELHARQEAQAEVYQRTSKSVNTILYRDQTKSPAVTGGGNHLNRPPKMAERNYSEKKFQRVRLDKDFDWVSSLRSRSPSLHELKANYTIAAPERIRKYRSTMTTRGRPRPLLMSESYSGSGNEPPFRRRHESNSLVFKEDMKAIPMPFKGEGKSNLKVIPKEN